MNNPTQKQIKEFWEWCGFTVLPANMWIEPKWVLEHQIGNYYGEKPPHIDLNNLFKYAVPKVKSLLRMTIRKIPTGYQWQIDRKPSYGGEFVIGEGDTETLALFWALWQVKEAK